MINASVYQIANVSTDFAVQDNIAEAYIALHKIGLYGGSAARIEAFERSIAGTCSS